MDRYRLGELAEVTGVAPRTIRFYIAQGVLPPPLGAGPAAVYTAGHRERLRLIARLKEDEYLSLRTIAGRLAKLSDAQVRAELQAREAPPPAEPAPPPPAAPPAARDGDRRRQARRAPGVSAPQNGADADEPPDTPVGGAPRPSREQWERIVLADGIELHVRADRRQERLLLDALIRQARALLGES